LCFNDPLDVPRSATLGFSATQLQAAVRENFLKVLEGERETNNPLLHSLSRALNAAGDTRRRRAVLAAARTSFEEMAPTTTSALDLFQQVVRIGS
jgi:hypothetical protein